GRNRDRDTDEFELLHRGDQGYGDREEARDELVDGPVSPVQMSPRRVRGEEREMGYEAYRPGRGEDMALGVAR
ncbi:hypothetical protein V496_08448, partial [Pseudogymnoascus sp. VKM F-4515 (FW-2607)]